MEQDALFFSNLLGELKNNLNAFIDPRDNLYKDLLVTPRGEKFYANHLGYVTLFPLMFGHIKNNSPELEATLNLLTDHTELWCMYGIRSLSRLNRFFGKDDNYWRGPIWINMNFMILRGLKKYYSGNQKAMNAYKQLRENLIKNICSEWNTRGYFFENYDSFTGKGQRNHPFNGWTSLISLIVAEDFY
jgi:mannosyl-oligosaccharide glucosidase